MLLLAAANIKLNNPWLDGPKYNVRSYDAKESIHMNKSIQRQKSYNVIPPKSPRGSRRTSMISNPFEIDTHMVATPRTNSSTLNAISSSNFLSPVNSNSKLLSPLSNRISSMYLSPMDAPAQTYHSQSPSGSQFYINVPQIEKNFQ